MVPAALFQKDSLNQKNYEYKHIHRDPSDSSRLRASKFSDPTVSPSSSSSSVSANTSIDHHPKTIPSDYSLGNLFSKSTGQDDFHQRGDKSPSYRAEEPAARVGLFGKIRQLTKLYGSAALVVYGLIGGVDFG
jgi:hypothetical protein